jgi:hypothetical protein
METAYEKVCPVCGNAAPLASKFCSGCGHEFRTVFHEQSEDVTTSSAAANSSSAADSRWAPALAVIPVLLVVFWMMRSTSVAVPETDRSPVAAASRADNVDSMSTLVQTGQTAGDVDRLFGPPSHLEGSVTGMTGNGTWYYVRAGHTLEIHFNANNVVDSVRKY